MINMKGLCESPADLPDKLSLELLHIHTTHFDFLVRLWAKSCCEKFGSRSSNGQVHIPVQLILCHSYRFFQNPPHFQVLTEEKSQSACTVQREKTTEEITSDFFHCTILY